MLPKGEEGSTYVARYIERAIRLSLRLVGEKMI